jgi:predicted outer membrane repeat protein
MFPRTPAPCLLLALPAATAAGAVIRVDVGGGDFATIQEGLNAASFGDTVLVACGTYYEHDIVMASGVLLVSETGDPACVTVDAQEQGRVFHASDLDASTHMRGLTVTGGYVPTGSWIASHGGGLLCQGSDLNIEDCIFSGNVAGYGGGIACLGSSPIIRTCQFTGNTTVAESYGGGGISCEEGSSPEVTLCTFSGNVATHGGGMLVHGQASPAIDRCEFSYNDAVGLSRSNGNGGAIGCFAGGSPAILDCSFRGNSAKRGGAIRCYNDCSPAISYCEFTTNWSLGAGVGFGGGVHCSTDSSPTVSFCTFVDNRANEGGGLNSAYQSSPDVLNCTF